MLDIEIEPSTTIETLRKAGIVPEWIAEDCEEHGMYEFENILCEWDWDLGDSYDKDQIEVFAHVRSFIHDALWY